MAQKKKSKATPAEKPATMHRTQKWRLYLTKEQERLLYRISDGLREYYNLALSWQQQQYEKWKEAETASPGQKKVRRFLTKESLYKIFKDELRPMDQNQRLFRATIPTNWVLEAYWQLESAYKSFFELRKRGDKDARLPKECPDFRFQVIQGTLNKSFRIKDNCVQFAPTFFEGCLRFSVPRHQADQMQHAKKFGKFTIARSEHDVRRDGYLTISIAYEIDQPETSEFIPEQAVFIALGANSIGVVSPQGEEVIQLRRPDTVLKPELVALRDGSKGLIADGKMKKGSGKHRDREAAFRTLFRHLANQQQIDRRRVVARDLLLQQAERPLTKRERRFARRRGKNPQGTVDTASGHGVHFVVTELVVRSKPSKLADASKPERGGSLGANWAAQNTGSLSYLVSWLNEKAKEQGGSVRRVAFAGSVPDGLSGDEKKIHVARALREQFLSDPTQATVL